MSQSLTAIEAVAHIRAQTGDTSKFKIRQRGYVDWKFGEVAEYLGFTRAEQYAISVRNRFDFQANYSECLLETTYTAFLEAEESIKQPEPIGEGQTQHTHADHTQSI